MEILLPLAHIVNNADMRGKIIRIGNSLGNKMALKEKDIVSMELHGSRLVVGSVQEIEDPFSAISCGGWYENPEEADELLRDIEESRRISTRELVEL